MTVTLKENRKFNYLMLALLAIAVWVTSYYAFW